MSYFPLKIQYVDGEIVIVESPAQIQSGRGFYVLETSFNNT